MEKSGRKGLTIGHGKGEKGYYVTDSKGFKYASDTPEMRQHLESLKVGMMIPAAIVGTSLGVTGYTIMMKNPWTAQAGYDFVSSMVPGVGAPAMSVEGVGAVGGSLIYDLVK